jgi:LmbE family N-acetylglucosaminyl deacetylase
MEAPSLSLGPWARYDEALRRAPEGLDFAALRASAVVFAPHPDDETLGCGGTIARKRRVGAPVHVVFVTDGAQSHAGLIPPDTLRVLREAEARAAVEALGVDAGAVTFLRAADGALAVQRAGLLPRVVEVLEKTRASQVFIPYHGDGPSDHAATNALVRDALAACGRTVDVYEYPVWIWYHWPRLPLPLAPRRSTLDLLRNSLRCRFGHRVLRDFRCRVDVTDVLAQKRTALWRHASQMTQLRADPRWLTLHDVANGSWLECFFSGVELFHRYTVRP